MQVHTQPITSTDAKGPVCNDQLPEAASAGLPGHAACTAPATQGNGDEHMQCDSPQRAGAVKTASFAGSSGRCSPDAMQTDSPTRSPKSEPKHAAFALNPALKDPTCDKPGTATAQAPAGPDSQQHEHHEQHQQQEQHTGTGVAGSPRAAHHTTDPTIAQAQKGGGQDQPQQGMVQAIGWPAMDLMTSMFGIQPHAVRMSDVPALTAQAQAQLQRASELLGAADRSAAHSCLASAAATAAVAAAAVAMNGSTPPQAAHMQQLLAYMQQQQQQLMRGGLSAAFMPSVVSATPGSGTHSTWQQTGNGQLPPMGPTGVFTANISAHVGSNTLLNATGSAGGLFQPPHMGPVAPPFGLPLPGLPSLTTAPHGLYSTAGHQGLVPLQLLQHMGAASVPWAIPTHSTQPHSGGLPHHNTQGSWQDGSDTHVAPGAASQAAQPHAVIGSAPPAICWPAQLRNITNNSLARDASHAGSADAGKRASANGQHPPLRRHASHGGTADKDPNDPAAAAVAAAACDSPTKQGGTMAKGSAFSLWSGDIEINASSMPLHNRHMMGGHGLPAQPNTGMPQQPQQQQQQQSAAGVVLRGGARSYRFVVQAANSTWRAQVGHNEAGTAKKYYGIYRRTAEQAARDADKLLYKLRGPAFPLNLGISVGERARIDRLSLDQLLDELHNSGKDIITEEAVVDGTASQSTGVGLLGATAPSPPPPCASPLYASSTLDAASALMFMSQDPLGGEQDTAAAGPAAAAAAGATGGGVQGGMIASPEPVLNHKEAADMACSDEDQRADGSAATATAAMHPAQDLMDHQQQQQQHTSMHVGVVPKQLRRKRTQPPGSCVGHGSPAASPPWLLIKQQQAAMECDRDSSAAVMGMVANMTSREQEALMHVDLPTTAAAAVLEPSDPSKDMQPMLLTDGRGWSPTDSHMPSGGGCGDAFEQDIGPHSMQLSTPQHSSRTRHTGRVYGGTGGKGTLGSSRVSPVSPAAEPAGHAGKLGASPYGLRSTATHDPQQTRPAPAADEQCQQMDGANNGRPLSAGRGGRVAGSDKPATEKPPYRYIVKIGSRWRAQVGQVDAGVQRKFYGPYLDDPALAARDADQILYKLRGPSAATNFPLPPDVRARLDCMTLSQLLQSFKANSSTGVGTHASGAASAAHGEAPTTGSGGHAPGGASRASSNGTSSSSAALQLQHQGSAGTSSKGPPTGSGMGPSTASAHAVTMAAAGTPTPETTTGSPPVSSPDECTASGSDAAGGSGHLLQGPCCCIGEETMQSSRHIVCADPGSTAAGGMHTQQRLVESAQHHAAAPAGSGRRSSGTRKHSGGWGGFPPAASAILAALAPAGGNQSPNAPAGGTAHVQNTPQGFPSAGSTHSMAPPPAIPLSSVLPVQMLRPVASGPPTLQSSASLAVGSNQQPTANQSHQTKQV